MSADNAARVDEAASLWLARRHSGAWTEADEAQLERWLNASTRHRVAYLRLERGWEKTARLKTLVVDSAGDAPPPAGRWNLSPFFNGGGSTTRARRRRHALRFAVAASVAAVLGACWFVAGGYRSSGSAYSTPVGGLASVPMADGSHITLNTDTAVRVAVTETARRVQLEHGEAFFDVARDPKRPFVVHAGDQRVVALGTQFSVRRDGDDVRVLVTEGQVKVESVGSAAPPTGAIGPGTVVNAKGKGVLLQRQPLASMQDELSWRTGFLVFRDATLADAVSELNRYSVRKIVIENPEVAALRIAGSFPAANVEGFLRLLEKGYPLRVDAAGEKIELRGDPE